VRAAACYGIEVIAAAAAVALEGHGHRVAAARLAFRGMVHAGQRSLRSRAEQLRCHAVGELAALPGGYRAG